MNNSNSKLYVIIAFLIGIILAQYVFSPPKEKEVVQVESENSEEAIQNAKRIKMARQKKVTLTAPKVAPSLKVSNQEVVKQDIERPTEQTQAATNAEANKKRRLELTLDDYSLQKLEQNINDLYHKVSMTQEDRGWRVSYLTKNNSMAAIGIQNNDLILYELINEARQDPRNEKLVTRLERVFYTLQR